MITMAQVTKQNIPAFQLLNVAKWNIEEAERAQHTFNNTNSEYHHRRARRCYDKANHLYRLAMLMGED